MLKRQLRTFRNSMVPWQEDRSVHLRKWASRRFQILLVKFTPRTMIHKSKLMCREHGSTNRTQEFVLLTREKQESSKFNSTITQTLFLLEKASMQHLSSTTLQELTEEFARMLPYKKTKSSPKSDRTCSQLRFCYTLKHVFVNKAQNNLQNQFTAWGFGVLGFWGFCWCCWCC